MYSIENFRAFNVRCFSDPRTFFNSELLSIYGTSFGGLFLQSLFKTNAVDKKCSSANTCTYSCGKSAVLPAEVVLPFPGPLPIFCIKKSGTGQKKESDDPSTEENISCIDLNLCL